VQAFGRAGPADLSGDWLGPLVAAGLDATADTLWLAEGLPPFSLTGYASADHGRLPHQPPGLAPGRPHLVTAIAAGSTAGAAGAGC
jgi:hypothetical protein